MNITEIEKRNIDNMIHELAMVARGCVIGGNATEKEILDYIKEHGNAEFERIFTAPEKEILTEMVLQILGHGLEGVELE